MNRATTLFFALALLLAHAVAIHHTAQGEFAPPSDQAYVAFRVARNYVHHGTAAWNPGQALEESYPSPLWVLLCMVPERLYLSPGFFAQSVGVLCALATVVVLAQFSRQRMAGVIAPLLLVFSGSVASAAISGLETCLLTLALTVAFLASERRQPRLLGLGLAVAVLTRDEGTLFVVGLAVLEWLRRRRDPDRPPMWRSFIPPLVALLALSLLRLAWTGALLSPSLRARFALDPQTWSVGFAYLQDFFLRSGSAPLVLFPLVLLALRKLRGLPRRALALSVFWSLLVVQQGGNGLPFWEAMVPILPIFLVAVQEAMTRVADTNRPLWKGLVRASFIVSLVASGLVSASLGDIGAVPAENAKRNWMAARAPLAGVFGKYRGRESLRGHIKSTLQLRAIGRFAREQLDARYSIMTFWPGATGYLSRRQVYDMLGRATALEPGGRLGTWNGAPKVDLVAALEEREPDYIVPTLEPVSSRRQVRAVALQWLERYDRYGGSQERQSELWRTLSAYELISVPVIEQLGSDRPDTAPFYLLRRQELGLQPELEIERLEDDWFRVLVRHKGHHQLIDLDVQLRDAEGGFYSLVPTGEFVPNSSAHARAGILLYPAENRPVELVRARLPLDLRAIDLSAVLRNPGFQRNTDFSRVSEQVHLPLRR